VAIHFIDTMRGFAATGGRGLMKIEDADVKWTTMYGVVGDGSWLSIQCFGAFKCYASTGSGVIAKTLDGGATWDSWYLDIGTLKSMHFPDANTGYAVGPDGTIVKLTNSDPVAVRTRHPNASLSAASVRDGILRYQVPNACRVKVTLFDTRGRVRRELRDGMESAGSKILSLPRSKPDGFLYIEIRTGKTRRVIPWF
jgi:hypothetical protein